MSRKKLSAEKEFSIQYNTIQYNTIQYNTIQYNTIQQFFDHLPKQKWQ